MKIMKSASFALLWMVTTVAGAQQPESPRKTAVYNPGLASLTFRYPDNFILDPKSHQGEAKWWARFAAPDGRLSIESMSHGYCSERLRIVEGFKSPEDYVLREVCGPNPERKKFADYDRLISRSRTSVTVIFLRHGAEWGRCYQQLTFSFTDGAYASVAKTIDEVIETALPSFDDRRWSEVDPHPERGRAKR